MWYIALLSVVNFNLVQPPMKRASVLKWQAAMSGSHSVDVKVLFPQYDMTPGEPGRKFRSDLLMNGTCERVMQKGLRAAQGSKLG